jgi:hypothetical protein
MAATSFILGWRVAASGGRWRVRYSTQGETGNRRVGGGITGRGVRPARPRMTGPVIPTLQSRCGGLTANRYPLTAYTEYSYVVTRSRPYPARLSREVVAVSGWRLGTQRDRGCDVIASLPCFAEAPHLHQPNRQPLSANRQGPCNPTVSLYCFRFARFSASGRMMACPNARP